MNFAADKPIAVVTGAARGIGAAVVRRLASDGFQVVAADRSAGLPMSAAGDGVHDLPNVASTYLDVTDERGIVDLFGSLARIDVLVTCAGIVDIVPFADISASAFRDLLDINLLGTFLPMREALKRMETGGRIVAIASRGALGQANCAHYVASKAGVIGLMRAAAIEYRAAGITVNAIAPGFVRTGMTLSLSDEIFASQVALEPRGRAAEPAEIADAIAFLVSDRAGFITGQTIYVDGGKSLGGFAASA